MKNPFASMKVTQIVTQKEFLIPIISIVFLLLLFKIGANLLFWTALFLILNRIGTWIGTFLFMKKFKKAETIDLLVFSFSFLCLGFYYYEVYKYFNKPNLLINTICFWIASLCFIVAFYLKKKIQEANKVKNTNN